MLIPWTIFIRNVLIGNEMVTKVLARFNCAILIHTLHGEKRRNVLLALVSHVFFCVIIITAPSFPLRAGSV